MRANIINAIALMVAAPLLGYSFAHSGPAMLASKAQTMLANASVGMSAGVNPNPYNQLAKDLNEKEASLEKREAAVSSKSTEGDTWGFYAFLMSSFLLVLVAINFYYDARRRSRPVQTTSTFAVDLR